MMKRNLIWLMALMLAAVLMACGSDDGNNTTDMTTDSTTDSTADGTTDSTADGTDSTPDSTPDGTPDTTPDGTMDTNPGACEPIGQTGCMAGERCVLDQAAAPICQPEAAMPVAVGMVCGASGGDDCATGSQCIQVEGETDFICRDICDISTGMGCSAGQICNVRAAMGSDLGYCSDPPPSCDILAQMGCGMGEGCYVVGSATETFTQCAAAGTTALGASCMGANDCVPGAICIVTMQGATMGTCTQLCDEAGMVGACDAGMCVDAAMAGLTGDLAGVGICRAM